MAFTFFFRDSHTLERAVDFLLPQVSGNSKIKVWNAGCAMGPETYTFAIILAERMNQYAFNNVLIEASDIDETENFGRILTEGFYPESDLKRLPEGILGKYFVNSERQGFYRVVDKVRSRVNFTKHDLLTLKPYGSGYSFIICKNVLLHFQPEQRIEVFKMFHSVLLPGGLVTTEQTQNLPDECSHLFKSMATDAHIYQKIG
jgi:chemotaxis protein methyltransferase CheR